MLLLRVYCNDTFIPIKIKISLLAQEAAWLKRLDTKTICSIYYYALSSFTYLFYVRSTVPQDGRFRVRFLVGS